MPQTQLVTILNFSAEGAFYVLMIIFVIHTIFLSYHWFNYGTDKSTGTTALATYLLGGAALFLTLSILLSTMN